jgi:hypothetical protein
MATGLVAARIGYLCAARCEGAAFDAFREELRRLGWVAPRTQHGYADDDIARAVGGTAMRVLDTVWWK